MNTFRPQRSVDLAALYAYLSHHAYLSAAYLWLVARVVKENLSSMPEEASGVSRRGVWLDLS